MSAESARQSDMTYFDVSFLIFLLQIVELPLGKLQRPLRYIWADVCVMEPQVPVQSWHAPRRHALWSFAPRLNSRAIITILWVITF